MPQYILLLHEQAGSFTEVSPEQMQAIIERYKAWGEALAAKGHLVGGEKLADTTGRVLKRGAQGVTITDGPYTETKELIGGFWRIAAADYEEAARLSSDCPHLDNGWIEIREIEAV